MPEYTKIEFSVEERIAYIVLSPPGRKPPTLDWDSLEQLDATLAQIEKEAEEIDAVIVRSSSLRRRM